MPTFFATPTFYRQGVVASFVLTPPGLDLVFNPFFESGVGWTWENAYLDTSFYEPIDFCHSSMRLDANSPPTYVTELVPHPVTPGQVYDVAVDVLSTGWPGETAIPVATMPASWTNLLIAGPHQPTGMLSLQVQFYDAAGVLLIDEDLTATPISTVTVVTWGATGGSWNTIGGSVTVPAGAAGMVILVQLTGETEQDWWLDNVQLELVQSPFVPDISIGVLFAQGLMYAPTLPPTLPAAPAPTGGALSKQSWLFYNTTSGFYWLGTDVPTVSDDAVLGWVVTNATGIAAFSARRLGTGPVEEVTPIGNVIAPGTAGALPNAPNVVSATAAASYGLYGNASAYKWSGSITLPTTDPDYVHLVKIVVQWTRAGGTPVTLATLYGPWIGGTAPWTSGVDYSFLQDASTYADSIQFLCGNENGAITAAPVSVAVSVEAAAVTGFTSAAEIGPQVIQQSDQLSRLVSTTLSFVPVLGSGQVPQNVTFLVSQDNGATWVYTGWSLMSTVGQAITVSKISPVASQSWKIAACIGAVGGDPTIFMPDAALAAAFPGVVRSGSFTVAGLALPAATAVTGASVGTCTNVIRADGTQYGVIGPCTYTDPTDLSFFVRVTVEQYNSNMASIYQEQPFSGFDIAGAGGTVRTTLPLDVTYVAGLAFIVYRIYLSSRASSGTYDFQNPLLAQVQSVWGSSVWGNANGFAVPVTLPANWGAGITTSPTTGLAVSTVAAQSILLDFDFELTGACATSATFVTIGTGLQTFTGVQAGLSFVPGQSVMIYDTPFASTGYMLGTVNVYAGTTLSINVAAAVGSGTTNTWTIFQTAPASAWTWHGIAQVQADGTAYSGSQYCRISGPPTVMSYSAPSQTIGVRAGESLYVKFYVRSSNSTPAGGQTHELQFQVNWFGVGRTFLSTTYPTFTGAALSGYVAAWGLVEGTIVVPTGAVTADVYLIVGTTEVPGGYWDVDSIGVQPVVRAANLHLSGALADDGSGNTTVKTGAGLKTVSNIMQAALGSGLTFDGSNNTIIPNLGYTMGINGSGQVVLSNLPAVGFLPSLPSATYPAGSVILLTSNDKIYRNASGSAWAVSSDPADLVAGAVASGVTLAASSVTAGTFIAGVAYIGAIACSQLTAGTMLVSSMTAGLVVEYSATSLQSRLFPAGLTMQYSGGSLTGVSLSCAGGSDAVLSLTNVGGGNEIELTTFAPGLFIYGVQVVGTRKSGPGAPSGFADATAQAWCLALYNALASSSGHGLIT